MEFKSVGEIKALTASGSFTGYAATWTLDRVMEKIVPGAFSKWLPALRQHGSIYWAHQTQQPPIAALTDAREDNKGLRVEAFFHGHKFAQKCRRVVKERLDARLPAGMSIGYRVRDSRRAGGGVTELLAVEVFEVSLTTTPANCDSIVESVKGEGALERLLEMERRRVGGAAGDRERAAMARLKVAELDARLRRLRP